VVLDLGLYELGYPTACLKVGLLVYIRLVLWFTSLKVGLVFYQSPVNI
jgi:hypothetical protein